MADTMTLEDVHEEMLPHVDGTDTHTKVPVVKMQEWADAIDAAIKQSERDAKDAARLDWLEVHPRLASIVIDGNATDCYLYGVSGAMGLKLREILDIAMAKESSNG